MKRKTIQEKRDDFIKAALNKQLEIAKHNKTYEDLLKIEDWFRKLTITSEEEKEFKKWFIKEYKRVFGRSGAKEYPWFNFMYGLMVDDYDLK